MLAHAMLFEEPRLLNSNLLPVNANGDVRFLSVVSRANLGSTSTPSLISFFSLSRYGVSDSIASSMAVSSSPRKMEIIAGGASLAPSLWSLPAVATDSLSRS